MKKFLWWLYQPYKWLIFTPILGITGMLLAIIAVILSILFNDKVGSMIGGISWARICAFFTPMWVKVRGKGNINPNQSYIVVSNHQSHYDIFVVYGWLWMDLKWVMKKELRKVPFIGYACEKVGHIIIDRSDHQAAVDSINAAKSSLVNGRSAMFFPEGTRSKDGKIGNFKKGAFYLAMDLGLPILPITIKGTRKILPSNTMNLLPGKAELIIHPPIDTGGYTESNISGLVRETREIISDSFYESDGNSN